MTKLEQITDRYQKGYITDVQLSRYVALGIITQEQADAIVAVISVKS
ncbi:MAG: XkdX family protein [Clostridiales bacterium]|nr:XkdX family protein [Clostridiales bacterium]